jgi:hypothetical protein
MLLSAREGPVFNVLRDVNLKIDESDVGWADRDLGRFYFDERER